MNSAGPSTLRETPLLSNRQQSADKQKEQASPGRPKARKEVTIQKELTLQEKAGDPVLGYAHAEEPKKNKNRKKLQDYNAN